MTNYHSSPRSDQLLVFVSDNTGVAAETLGMTIMIQMGDYLSAQQETLPFIRTEEDVEKYTSLINSWIDDFQEIVVFSTFVDMSVRKYFKELIRVPMFDVFDLILPKVSLVLNKEVVPIVGNRNNDKKDIRSAAIDYALDFDDGKKLDFDKADIILVGLSRSGKTPTALWLALHYGLNAANYPLTEEDFEKGTLPENLVKNLSKCVLLLQTPQRLSEIRQERYKNSKYASLENCKMELSKLQKVELIKNIPQVNVSNKSVEEIAANALMLTNIHPKGRF